MADLNRNINWKKAYSVLSNPYEAERAAAAQTRAMDEIFAARKKDTTLASWNAEQDDSLPLFAACGVLRPAEYAFFRHSMDSMGWTEDTETDSMVQVDINEPVTVSEFLKELATNHFDTHRNLLMRMEPILPIMRNLDIWLGMEGVRTSKEKHTYSMVNELLNSENAPEIEDDAWFELNEMAANKDKEPYDMSLPLTKHALGRLNRFKINRSFAELKSFADLPVVPQYTQKGKVVEPIHWLGASMNASIDWMIHKCFLNEEKLAKVYNLSPAALDKEELKLKCAVIQTALGEIAKASPSEEWCRNMFRGFARYFAPILEVTGKPAVKWTYNKRQENGVEKKDRVLQVAFPALSGVSSVAKEKKSSKDR